MSQDTLFPKLGRYDIPAFDGLDRSGFAAAFDAAMAAHRAEIDAVADNPEPPTFANTVAAMEQAGEALDRTASSFFALAGADEALSVAAVGSPATVRRELGALVARYRPDEVIVASAIHDHAKRVSSLEIAAEAFRSLEGGSLREAAE